jgi:hypothetical protein
MDNAVILSIGLNVGGAEPEHQMRSTLSILDCIGTIRRHQIINGEWEGVKERTIHALVELPGFVGEWPDVEVEQVVAAAARVLGQECIAVRKANPKHVDPWTLVYADGRVTVGGTVEEFPPFGK